jgi:sugar phosphate isomerase/epimerase
MDIALNTDIVTSGGSPEPWLRLISEAGFTHLHWCHQWCTDVLYSRYEIAQYKQWLKQYGLQLLDIHGSAGMEKCWWATEEYRRRSGVELVINRIEMFAEMGGSGALMMHAPAIRTGMAQEAIGDARQNHEALRKSFDELMPVLEKYQICIAIENTSNDTFELITDFLDCYPAEYCGITYDSGHGNIDQARGLELLEPVKDRLQALHLNDNDTSGDLHQPPFMGTVDWDTMAKIIATSSYTNRPLSFELAMRNTPFYNHELKVSQPEEKVREFLNDTYQRCQKVVHLVEEKRKSPVAFDPQITQMDADPP